MEYREYKPSAELSRYIDAYWIVRGVHKQAVTHRILPDGCADLIFNLGNDVFTTGGNKFLRAGKINLVGTMTRYAESFNDEHTKLVGIRFKPGCLPLFYRVSMSDVTDDCVELDNSIYDTIASGGPYILQKLNRYFLSRLEHPEERLSDVINGIISGEGKLRIDALARKYFITRRQLERKFQFYVGVSPKEFSGITRFRSALAQLRKVSGSGDLEQLATDHGYYDRAHLANEIKRYSGLTPGAISF